MSDDLVAILAGIKMCTVDDIIGGEPCLRVAQRVRHPEADDHPVYLYNFHAEPFAPFPEAPHPVVHLGIDHRTACGRWSKWSTTSTASVTCPECRKTWDFAVAERRAGPAAAKRDVP
jgi:hypothetical protein